MCYSQAEGGQRCFGDAHTRYRKAVAAYNADPTDDFIFEDLITAQIEYASTKQGEANLIAKVVAAQANEDEDLAEFLSGTIVRGRDLREKNAAVRALATGKSLAESRHEDDVAFGDADPEAVGVALAQSGQELVPEAESNPALADFRSDLQAQFSALREPALVSTHATAEQARAAALDQARAQLQEALETGESTFGRHNIPTGGDPTVLPQSAYKAAIAMTAHAGKGYNGKVAQEYLGHYANNTWPDDPYATAEYARFQVQAERYFTAEQARAALIAGRAESRLTSLHQYPNSAIAEDAAEAAVLNATELARHDGSRAPNSHVRYAAAKVFQVLSKSPNLTEEQACKWTADMIRDLGGRNVAIVKKRDWRLRRRYRIKVLD